MVQIAVQRLARWLVPPRLAGGVVVVLSICACTSGSDSVPPLPETAESATITTQQRSERDAVIDAYKEFWPQLTKASAQPEAEWPAVLAEVATDPQLSRSLAGIRQLRAQSRTIYGSVSERVSVVDVSGNKATLKDCQDASRSGQADATTGDPKTAGVERNPVTATLVRGADKGWRVSEILYPGGTC